MSKFLTRKTPGEEKNLEKLATSHLRLRWVMRGLYSYLQSLPDASRQNSIDALHYLYVKTPFSGSISGLKWLLYAAVRLRGRRARSFVVKNEHAQVLQQPKRVQKSDVRGGREQKGAQPPHVFWKTRPGAHATCIIYSITYVYIYNIYANGRYM